MGDNTDELTVTELFERLATRTADEEGELDYSVPNHAPSLVVDEAAALLQTARSIDMAEQMAEDIEDAEPPTAEEREDALIEDAVDVVIALATLQYEADIDIAEGIHDRLDFIEDYDEFKEAMQNAEDESEQMEVMDELLTEELAEELGMEMAEDPLEAGQNVDDEDYDHDNVENAFH